MHITKITLKNYRNYDDLRMSLGKGIHLLRGKNAQGKTNLLEAIHYATLAKSHRTNDEKDLIKNDAMETSVNITFERFDTLNTLKFELFRSKNRIIELNTLRVQRKKIVSNLIAVLFSPEDLALIKGSPANRRLFLDMEISKADPLYYQALIFYKKILSERNSLLKQIREKKAEKSLLTFWNQKHIEISTQIVKHRLLGIDKISKIAKKIHLELTNNKENLDIAYKIKHLEDFDTFKDLSKIENTLELCYNQKIKEILPLEIERGYTLIGPHRDDLELKLDNLLMQNFASQGQQRTAVLALKLSLLTYLKEEEGEYPILLLDDVLSELDKERKEKLLQFSMQKDIQTIITTTDAEDILAKIIDKNIIKYYQVENGMILPG